MLEFYQTWGPMLFLRSVILQPYNLSDKMRGMMAENFVAEQLVANGFTNLSFLNLICQIAEKFV